MREYTEQELVRREKAKKLLEKNIDPFGSKYDITSDSKTIKELYSEMSNEELEQWYDKTYDLLLMCFMFNNYLSFRDDIKDLNKNLKNKV